MIKYNEINKINEPDLEYIKNNYKDLPMIGEGTNSHVMKWKNYAVKMFFDKQKQWDKYNEEVYTEDPKILMTLQENEAFPKIYGFGEDKQQVRYMISEYISGVTLTNFNPQIHKLDSKWCIDLQSALDYIRFKKLHPSDLISENIIIDMKGKIKIIDVGSYKDPTYEDSNENIIEYVKMYLRSAAAS